MSERILVTGSRGFLAGHLIHELRARRPRARLSLAHRTPARGYIACDLLDPGSVRRLIASTRPDIIFHLAGCPHQSPWRDLWNGHVTTTYLLLEAVRSLPGASKIKIVISGSAAEYGIPAALTARPTAIRESDPCLPVSDYGRTKLCQTLLTLSYRHAGLRVRIARIFNVLGPGTPEHLALGSFAAQIARVERGLQPPQIRVGTLTSRRDYVDARDIAAALVSISAAGKDGEIYNVCSGRSRPIGDLLRELLSFSTHQIKITPESSRRRRVDAPDIFGNADKIRSATGWRPKIDLHSSLIDTLAWHRSR